MMLIGWIYHPRCIWNTHDYTMAVWLHKHMLISIWFDFPIDNSRHLILGTVEACFSTVMVPYN